MCGVLRVRSVARSTRHSSRASPGRRLPSVRARALPLLCCCCCAICSSMIFLSHPSSASGSVGRPVRSTQHVREVVLSQRRRGAGEGAGSRRAWHQVGGAVGWCVRRVGACANLCVLAFLFRVAGGLCCYLLGSAVQVPPPRYFPPSFLVPRLLSESNLRPPLLFWSYYFLVFPHLIFYSYYLLL